MIEPFRRIWCLFEVDLLEGKPLTLITEDGPLQDRRDSGSSQQILEIFNALAGVSACDAVASDINDKLSIWYLISNEHVRRFWTQSEFLAQGRNGELGLSRQDFSDFDTHVGSLLATSMLRASLQSMGPQSIVQAMQSIMFGAKCTVQDIQLIIERRADLYLPLEARFSAGTKCNLVHAAAYFGNQAVLSFLIEQSVSIETRTEIGATPLLWAVAEGNVDMVNFILSCRADMNCRCGLGAPPMHWAAKCDSKAVAHLLLQSPDGLLQLSSPDFHGHTPMHWAAKFGMHETSALFIDHKANVNATDSQGTTPLHYAASFGHLPMAALLLDSKANLEIKDTDGLTATDLARIRTDGKEDMLDLLQGCQGSTGNASRASELILAKKSKQSIMEYRSITEPLYQSGAGT